MHKNISPTCQEGIREACITLKNACDPQVLDKAAIRMREYENEFGRILYTISILIMFSFVIILLMVRSIRRTQSTVEMDSLLDAMRIREELEIQERKRRRLMRAKTQVTAWLVNKNKEKGPEKRKDSEWKPLPNGTRPRGHYSISTVTSDIPEIVVSADDCIHSDFPNRPHTPAISMIYDFGIASPDLIEPDSRKPSISSSTAIPMSSSSSSSMNSLIEPNMNSIKSNPRTYSLDTNASTSSRTPRVDCDDKSCLDV
uniref:MPS-1 n=1 Tax=Caenorhabditis elegans TaxID=6239 RepID=Q86GJ0_CAEEL|nr:MPS-1 [Caenorhabditis elegans]